MRATTADRNRFADYLSQAYATGQLDDTELSQRLDAALSAKTIGDLNPLVADLNFAALAPGPFGSTAPLPVPVAGTPAGLARPARPAGTHRVATIVAAALAGLAITLAGVIVAGIAVRQDPPYLDPCAGGVCIAVAANPDQYVYSGVASQLPPTITVDEGSPTLDLTQVVVDANTHVQVMIGTGDATILLPSGAFNSAVAYDVGQGVATCSGVGQDARSRGGTGATGVCSRIGDPNLPTLTVDVQVGSGSLTVG